MISRVEPAARAAGDSTASQVPPPPPRRAHAAARERTPAARAGPGARPLPVSLNGLRPGAARAGAAAGELPPRPRRAPAVRPQSLPARAVPPPATAPPPLPRRRRRRRPSPLRAPAESHIARYRTIHFVIAPFGSISRHPFSLGSASCWHHTDVTENTAARNTR